MISIRDLDKELVLKILKKSEEMHSLLKKKGKVNVLADKVLATLFFEPSTRTKLSFQTAIKRLGGRIIEISDVKTTSMAKGENISDTVKIVEKYADLIVIRHPLEGSARYVSEITKIPVINGGDGANQHPTQTLLDLFAVKNFGGDIKNQKVALVGDLRHARTMRSLAYSLAMFGAEMILVSPEGLRMSKEYVNEIKRKFSPTIRETSSLEKGVADSDILYVCRIQKERFADPYEAKRLQKAYKIDLDLLEKHAKPDLFILHPLPKTSEIDPAVDNTKYAKYFEQASFGVPVRMALISLLMKNE